MNNLKIKIIILLVILAAVFGVISVSRQGRGGPEELALESLARCLAAKEVIMYGADWCPHCQNEKRAFGRAFKLVPYVECPKEPQKCLALGISGYPTWIFSDGRRLEGEQGVKKLSEVSGCPLQNYGK